MHQAIRACSCYCMLQSINGWLNIIADHFDKKGKLLFPYEIFRNFKSFETFLFTKFSQTLVIIIWSFSSTSMICWRESPNCGMEICVKTIFKASKLMLLPLLTVLVINLLLFVLSNPSKVCPNPMLQQFSKTKFYHKMQLVTN